VLIGRVESGRSSFAVRRPRLLTESRVGSRCSVVRCVRDGIGQSVARRHRWPVCMVGREALLHPRVPDARRARSGEPTPILEGVTAGVHLDEKVTSGPVLFLNGSGDSDPAHRTGRVAQTVLPDVWTMTVNIERICSRCARGREHGEAIVTKAHRLHSRWQPKMGSPTGVGPAGWIQLWHRAWTCPL
jgi:hypothetical protein